MINARITSRWKNHSENVKFLSLSLHTHSQRDKHALGIARSLVEYFSSLDTFNFYSNTRRVLNFLLLFVIQLKRGKFELFFMKPSGECEAAGEAQWTQVDNTVFVPGLVHTRKPSQERCRKHNRNSFLGLYVAAHRHSTACLMCSGAWHRNRKEITKRSIPRELPARGQVISTQRQFCILSRT